MSPTAAVTKPVLPPLQTPKTGTFPSELAATPISACLSVVIKQEQDLRTPITPPAAYTDFLKALTPVLASPPPSALHRSLSDESTGSGKENASISTITSHGSNTSRFAFCPSEAYRSPAATSLPPPTPYSATSNPRRTPTTGLNRLRIPQLSPGFSPLSTTGPSPRTGLLSSTSTAPLYSPFSPADWVTSAGAGKSFDSVTTPRSACSKPVSVRSVVTRTVTYKRTTPCLAPAPKGKKRKTLSSASSTADMTSEDERGRRMPPPTSATTSSTASRLTEATAAATTSTTAAKGPTPPRSTGEVDVKIEPASPQLSSSSSSSFSSSSSTNTRADGSTGTASASPKASAVVPTPLGTVQGS